MKCMEDAYQNVCSVFTRLCPRLVPSPLWGISLANLARADPDVVCGIAYGDGNSGCTAIVNELRRWWFSLPRDYCRVCGSPASDVDEDWKYCIENGAGRATLEELVPLCEKCHLAKHLGYSAIHGKDKEALEHLARVNGIDIEAAKLAVWIAFEIYSALSKVDEWKIVLKGVTGLPKDAAEVIENILNFMAGNGYSFDGDWLWYHARREQREQLEEKALKESEELLCKTLGVHNKSLDEIVNSVRENPLARPTIVEGLKEALSRYGIRVLQRETEIALKVVFELGKSKQTLLTLLTGKWIVFVPSKLRGVVLRRVIDELRKRRLDYSAKTVGVEESDRDEQPIIVYVPSFLAISIVKEVAEVILETLKEVKIDKPIMFKPDVFTHANIYRDTVKGIKPYIYMTSLRLKSYHAATP